MLQSLLLLLFFIVFPLKALEISINSALEEHQRYATLHLKNSQNFVCQAYKDDFFITTKVVCAFKKKPETLMKTIQNDFFSIESVTKEKTFFLIIKPYHKMKLLPIYFDLTKDSSVFQGGKSFSKHWMIVGYKEKLPLIYHENSSETGINFPFFMDKDKLPYVGSLDIKGNPVYIKQVEDVTDYLKIKKYFSQGKYEQSLDLINSILEEYPNTLFKAELIYYKIKVYKKLNDNDNIIELSKFFLREFSSDENVAEVLSLIAQAYSLIGQSADADYFFDRLFSEHKQSVYAKWGYIYKGKMLEDGGGESVAVKFYKRALQETKNLDVAVSAAFRLVVVNISKSQKEAQKYMEKILRAKPAYLYEHYKIAKGIMYEFADGSKYDVASKMAKALLESMPKDDENYETILKDEIVWLSKLHKQKYTLGVIKEYLKLYPDGVYIDTIERIKDSLFFEQNDLNNTTKLREYTKLMEEYLGDSIGDKALYEKAKLLLEMHDYSQVLNLQKELESLDEEIYADIPQLIYKAAIGAMEYALEKNECQNVLRLSKDYKITLSDKWDDGIYACGMKGGDYQLARQVANKNLHSKDIEIRKKWLYRYVKIDFATGNYSDVIDASKDLLKLIEGIKEQPYIEVYRYLFDTYERLEKNDAMLDAISKIQKVFGLDYKDLDRYVAMMHLGSVKNDDTIVIRYGENALEIQKRSHSNPQSPYLEFTLFASYMKQEDYNKAFEVIKLLNKVKLNKTQRARQKYLLGTVLSKLWRDEAALNAYKEAIASDPDSPWAELAKSAQEI